MSSSELLTVDQVAEYLKIKRSTLYSKLSEIRHYKLGRLIRFKKEDVETWMEGNKKDCVAPEKVARKALRVTGRTKLDIDRIVRKAIDGAKRKGYTNPTGNRTKSRASERRFMMGLFKRGSVWWMRFIVSREADRKIDGDRRQEVGTKNL